MHLSDEIKISPMITKHNEFKVEKTHEPVKSIILNFSDAIQDNREGCSVQGHAITVPLDMGQIVQKKPVYNFIGKTILAVDDVNFNLNLIDIYFKSTGAKMLFATNGLEAVDIFISNLHIDIILMDIQMPVMNGLDATHEILKHRPEMKVIAITAFVHPDDKQRCFDAGCVNYLPKPCSRGDLLKMVSNYLYGS
jgi:CheY-like chemotaxis protein